MKRLKIIFVLQKKKDEINENRFLESIKLACLENLYEKLIKSGDYNIGDRGIKLSGGQRQRVGIARALYNDKNLIGLDEATSALDNNTEEKIIKNLQSIKKNKIIILISHREETMRKCDEIILLKKGKLVFTGQPKDYFANKKF